MRSQHLPIVCTGLVFALLALTYALFRRNVEAENNHLQLLSQQYQERLNCRKMHLQHLKEMVGALSDPQAGEKVLIEELGVVPKGMKRVEYER